MTNLTLSLIVCIHEYTDVHFLAYYVWDLSIECSAGIAGSGDTWRAGGAPQVEGGHAVPPPRRAGKYRSSVNIPDSPVSQCFDSG